MTDFANAETLRKYYLTHNARKTVVNLCNARPNWNGCDYADIYGGCGCECWKQDGKHNCIRCYEGAR